ncbi:leucine zipper transcription factor-like protein 1 isoform X1 [Echinops telfairi]|uniref:Leucine zipper transcription factor-like protein 1 isoform X1 n=1 Tax=Echinops telfairi TaxID=9371 RepID=A0AC55DNT0_ECHTE|nr:leucine zipper transcription factor-like protein 1 isoform X1 [Echinops telfairi]
MAELGLNDHHQNEIINYMRFARSKRGLRLKTVDSCFQDLKESRLVEETFTVDEVSEVLSGLRAVVHSEVESELINTAHTNVLLLRQLFAQAEKWYLKLQTDISELENRELLEQVAEFEKAELTSSNKKPIADIMKPKLAPLNETGTAELLNKEILRLQEENEKLKSRLKTVEIQATSALDAKSKLERALRDAHIDQEVQQVTMESGTDHPQAIRIPVNWAWLCSGWPRGPASLHLLGSLCAHSSLLRPFCWWPGCWGVVSCEGGMWSALASALVVLPRAAWQHSRRPHSLQPSFLRVCPILCGKGQTSTQER